MFDSLSLKDRISLLDCPMTEQNGNWEPTFVPFEKPQDRITLISIFGVARNRLPEQMRAKGWTSNAAEREETLKILYPELASGALLATWFPTYDITHLSEQEKERKRADALKIPRDIKDRILYKGTAEEVLEQLRKDWEEAHAKGANEELGFMNVAVELFTPEHLYSPDWGYEQAQP